MAAKKTTKPRPQGRPKGKPRSAAEIAADKKRTGRPVSLAGQTASKGVTMRLISAEHKQFKKDAKRLNMGLSVYLRYCWQTAREGREEDNSKNIPKSGPADKPRHRKKGKRV